MNYIKVKTRPCNFCGKKFEQGDMVYMGPVETGIDEEEVHETILCCEECAEAVIQ